MEIPTFVSSSLVTRLIVVLASIFSGIAAAIHDALAQ